MAHTESKQAYQTVDDSRFAKDITSDDFYLLDVRTTDEYNGGHIENAHNIEVLDPNFAHNAKTTLPKDKIIAVYCGTGKRSGIASERLTNMGYKVVNLEGGLTEWEKEGYPVQK